VIVELTHGTLRTLFGEWMIYLYWDGKQEAIALTLGEVAKNENTLVRIHSSCITGHTFMSVECECREQMIEAMGMIRKAGCGVIIWLNQEGRSNGTMAHVASQVLKRQGMSQSEAYKSLGYSADARTYETAAEILAHIGLKSIVLLSCNASKLETLRGNNIEVTEFRADWQTHESRDH
jgi:GTP cyclohydrolase II